MPFHTPAKRKQNIRKRKTAQRKAVKMATKKKGKKK